MEKARNSARSQLVNNLGSALSRAITLGEDALFYDQPGRINTHRGPDREGHARRRAARGETVSGEDRPHGRDHRAEGARRRKESL